MCFKWVYWIVHLNSVWNNLTRLTSRQISIDSGAKSWQLGWYASKSDSISPSSTGPTYTTKLAGIVDYSTTSNKVLIEIQQTSSTTFYYVNYNRASGINAQTQFGADQVLIASKDTSTESNVSMSLAALAAGQSFSISDFNGNTGQTLTITFISLESNEANVEVALSGFSVGPSVSVAPSLSPSQSNVPSQKPSIFPSGKPSVDSSMPSLSPTQTSSESPTHVASGSPSQLPTSVPSHVPTRSPSLQPVTTAPTARIPVQRTATVALEIGLAGLDHVDVICSGVGSFLEQGVQDAYGSDCFSTVTCEQEGPGLGRKLVGKFNIFWGIVFDYEKPAFFTVTTTFIDHRTAPREYGFAEFLEQLIVSDKAQEQVPGYVQNAEGGQVFDTVHVRLVFTPAQEPIMILGFGEDAPTGSPTVNPFITIVGNAIAEDGREEYPSSGEVVGKLHQSLAIVCTMVAGIMVMVL